MQDKISLINNMYLLIIAVICCFPIINIIKTVSDKRFTSKAVISSAAAVAAALLLVITSIMLVDSTTHPFLYYRF
jgi:alginate O-acetyltransferase complex protein AlgI